METAKRLIDANAIPWGECYVPDIDRAEEWAYKKELSVLKPVVDQMPTVDAVEVVHGRFVRIADFGDGEGCFGYCEKCGTVHHAQSPVALKADHRWCRWCGAKMDGDGNG